MKNGLGTEPPAGGKRLHATRAGGFLLAGLLACTTPGPAPSPEPRALAEGELRVRLGFGADADLDLYVTDPADETVYYGNTPSRHGGVLVEDLRCDAPTPRFEEVSFRSAPAGRYRVGVDHPARCRAGRRAVPFVVLVESGEQRFERRGEVPLGVFLPIVLELEIGPD